MADYTETTVFCGKCGEKLDQPSNLPVELRTPCPECGSLARRIDVQIFSMLSISSSLTTRLTPGKQERDWRQRLIQIREQLTQMLASHTQACSAETINAANHEVQSYFVQAYHIKDALIQDAATTGIAKKVIEGAVTSDPHLALLADLANLDKHGALTKGARSGDIPAWKASGVSDSSPGWRLSLEISHKGKTVDGLAFANDVLTAWESQMRSWKLI